MRQFVDPFTIYRLAQIRQQEILAAAAADRQVTPPWRAMWRALMARRQSARRSSQPAPASARLVKPEAL